MKDYSVKAIDSKDTYDMLLNIHYAKRIPSISYAFGLFFEDELVGAVTYGTPPSPSLRTGIAGKDYESVVLELNRLVLINNKPNEASFLVAKSLNLLPSPSIVVSFADKSQGHKGFVYQACNFYYSGLSAKRTDWKLKGKEHLHGMTIADEFRGMPNRSQLMKEKYGDDFYLKERPRKHRYIYFIGNKYQKLELKRATKYPLSKKYPKGD